MIFRPEFPARHDFRRLTACLSVLVFACGLIIPAGAQEQRGFPAELDQLGIQRGNPDAEVVVREFADYQCPACRAFAPTVKRLIEEYVEAGRVRFVFFDFPLDVHEHAIPAAEAARCAGRQGAYWPMHDALFENQPQWSDAGDPVERFADYAEQIGIDGGALAECVRENRTREIVEQNRLLAGQLRLRSTPTLLVGNTGIRGVADWGQVKQVVERELAGGQADAEAEQAGTPEPLDPDRELKTVASNRMSAALSPYLQLHADNPVDWYPWSEEAFEKARAENKPVFLSIGYFTCYWCHVMERESFSDPEIADRLNRFFVSIKVDREQRPGVDGLYMRAVNIMGQRGGWPLSMFLTPDRKPFFGGTYYPRSQFTNVLDQIRAAWRQQPDRIRTAADRVTRALGETERVAGVSEGGGIPAADVLQQAEAAFVQTFDEDRGGFGDAPKFPQPSILVFLLDRHQRAGSERALKMVTSTLDAMAAGGIRDHLGGGFHRYSTDARWHVPHFEKMLYDNAQLLKVYAQAWHIINKPLYREVVEDIVQYLDSTLTDPETGLLYSAQSSLVHEEEGESYIWTSDQVQAALEDDQHFKVAGLLYGLDGEPDLDGAHVLHRTRSYAEIASRLDSLDAGDIGAMHEEIDKALLASRDAREQAPVGTKHVLSWNALAVEALAYSGRVMEEPGLVDRAEQLADAVMQYLYNADGGPWLAIRGQSPGKVRAQSFDYAALAAGYLELTRATGDPRFRQQTADIAADMITVLWNAERGLFNRRAENEELLVETTDLRDGVVPAGNSMAAVVLTELAEAGSDSFAPYAATVMRAHGRIMDKQPSRLPMMLTALASYRDAELPRTASIPTGTVGSEHRGRPTSVTSSDAKTPGLELEGVGGGVAAGGPDSSFSGSRVSMTLQRISSRELHIELQVDEGWHINANPASLEFLIPTEVSLFADNRRIPLQTVYPEPKQIPAEVLGEGPIDVYSGSVIIDSRFQDSIAPNASLRAVVELQVCNDKGRCLAPDKLEQTLGD